MPNVNDVPVSLHVLGNETAVGWLSAALLLGFFLSAYGWGALLRQWLPLPLLRLASVSIVVGMALLNVIGGWLNVAKLAHATALVTLLFTGVLLAIVELKRTRGKRTARVQTGRKISHWPPFAVALILTVLFFALLNATPAFNLHDDFFTYISRSLNMVQTGTLAGNPFDPVGFDSLGAQAFFQGFFFPNVDIRLLHAFDELGCFALALFAVAELAVSWRISSAAAALAVIAVAVINPQYVNISALYSGVAVIIVLLACGAALAKQIELDRPRTRRGYELLVASLVALLVSLKLTLAFFASLYLVSFYALALIASGKRKTVLRSAAITAIASVLLAAPWLFLHVPTFARGRTVAVPFANEATLAHQHVALAAHAIRELFTNSSMFWGDWVFSFDLLVIICLMAALAGWWMRRRFGSGAKVGALLSVSAAASAVLIMYLLNAHLFSADNAIRYSCPVLIACSVGSLIFLLRFTARLSERWRGKIILVLCGVMTLIIGVFGKTFCHRITIAAHHHTLIAFPVNGDYVAYSKLVLMHDGPYFQKLQSLTEPDSTILVWTASPFHFDFARNRLLPISEAGLINPVVAVPAGISTERLREYLRGLGIRYVCFQLPGAGVRSVEEMSEFLKSPSPVERKIGAYGIYFRQALGALATQSKMVYRDDAALLFDLSEARAAQTK